MQFSTRQAKSKPASPLRRVFRSPALSWGLAGVSAIVLLVALLYAEENWRGQRAWTAYHRLLLAKGVDFNWGALAPPPVAERDNFAATPFFAALFDYAPGTHTPRNMAAYNRTAGFAQTGEPYLEQRRANDPMPAMFYRRRTDLSEGLESFRKTKEPPPGQPRSSETSSDRTATAAAVCQTLAKYNSVLDELRLASRRPEARFNFSYDEENTWRTPQPHLPVLKRVSAVLALRASAELALRNAPAATDDVRLIFALADSQWARYAMLASARQVVWEGLADHRWSDEQLAQFQARLQQLALVSAIQKPLRSEQASINKLFGDLHRKPVTVKSWRFGSGVGNMALPYFLWLMPGGWMLQEQVSYDQFFEDKLLSAVDTETGRIHAGLIHDSHHVGSALWNHRLLSDVLLQSVESLLTGAALAQTGRNQAILACALERYRLANGRFPENLDSLSPQFITAETPSDVITGKSMKYRRTDENRFQLYSVGWNEKDDGGKVAMNPDGKTPNVSEGDWVWPAYPED
jgi:hypothetical protein